MVSLKDEQALSEIEWDERLEAEEDSMASAKAEEDEAHEPSVSDERGHPSSPLVLINPVIVAVSPHTAIRPEACLSIPGYALSPHTALPFSSASDVRSVCGR